MENLARPFNVGLIEYNMRQIMKYKTWLDGYIISPMGESYSSNHIHPSQIDEIYSFDPNKFCMTARLKNPGGKPIYMELILIDSDEYIQFKIFMTQDCKLFKRIITTIKCRECDADDDFPKDLFDSVDDGNCKLEDIPSHLRKYCEIYAKTASDYREGVYVFRKNNPNLVWR